MCSDTPRFSYSDLKTTVCHGVPVPSRVVHAVSGCRAVPVRGMGGWVYRVGNTGCTQRARFARGEVPVQRSGPRSPAGAEWVVRGARTPAAPGTHPSGPVGTPAGSLPGSWTLPASWPIGARFHDILLKVSQKAIVSPKGVEKASHSPYLPKRVPEVTSWISRISVLASLLSQGINGLYLTGTGTLLSK